MACAHSARRTEYKIVQKTKLFVATSKTLKTRRCAPCRHHIGYIASPIRLQCRGTLSDNSEAPYIVRPYITSLPPTCLWRRDAKTKDRPLTTRAAHSTRDERGRSGDRYRSTQVCGKAMEAIHPLHNNGMHYHQTCATAHESCTVYYAPYSHWHPLYAKLHCLIAAACANT